MAGNPKCMRYDPKDKQGTPTCINCHSWRVTKCKFHSTLGKEIEVDKEFENLMRHDGYERKRGAVRQTRRG